MKTSWLFTLLLLMAYAKTVVAQNNSCQFQWGINLSDISDYGTELPFVDMMHSARQWFSKELDNPNDPWDSEHADELSYRPDGYPTEIPQTVTSSSYQQQLATFWIIATWPQGTYTLLWEGSGEFLLNGFITNIQQVDSHTYTFELEQNLPSDAYLQLIITQSELNDPIHNIRLIIPDALDTYQTQAFNPDWLEKLSAFSTVRFMDWGHTNNWGQPDPWGSWNDTTLFHWEDRSQPDHYTWAYNKGVPYEIMVQLMNQMDLDGWICVPHRASDEYIQQMAAFFRDNLEPQRKIYLEYSNEIWNWIFGQTQWLYEYGCVQQNLDWPEGIVPYIQNCLDIWTEAFAGQEDRLVRVVGLFTAWQDVSNRIVFNLSPGSFDAIAPTFYFGLSEEADSILDGLGNQATTADIAFWVRQNFSQELAYIQEQKETIADSLGLPMLFYEGGQHITPQPFGEEPTYAQALLDLQRDTAMYNLYTEWFDMLRQLNDSPQPWLMNHFNFIVDRSARYGSWGLLESLYQDTSAIPAPKYRAVLEAMEQDPCLSTASQEVQSKNSPWQISPNPLQGSSLAIKGPKENEPLQFNLYDLQGHLLFTAFRQMETSLSVRLPDHLPKGAYYLHLQQGPQRQIFLLIK